MIMVIHLKYIKCISYIRHKFKVHYYSESLKSVDFKAKQESSTAIFSLYHKELQIT